jgi:hypothetical protein
MAREDEQSSKKAKATAAVRLDKWLMNTDFIVGILITYRVLEVGIIRESQIDFEPIPNLLSFTS